MADKRVLAELERLVEYVSTSSATLRAVGQPTDSQLAYAGGALEMLRKLDLISDPELEEWFDRAHEAAGGDDEHPLVEMRDVTVSVTDVSDRPLGRLRRRWRRRGTADK